MYDYVHISVNISRHIKIYVYIYMYNIYIYMCICIYIYMCICIHIYIYGHHPKNLPQITSNSNANSPATLPMSAQKQKQNQQKTQTLWKQQKYIGKHCRKLWNEQKHNLEHHVFEGTVLLTKKKVESAASFESHSMFWTYVTILWMTPFLWKYITLLSKNSSCALLGQEHHLFEGKLSLTKNIILHPQRLHTKKNCTSPRNTRHVQHTYDFFKQWLDGRMPAHESDLVPILD